MEEITLSVSWGGTVDTPTWRVSVSRFKLGEGDALTVLEDQGTGPYMAEQLADEIVGVLMHESYRMLADQFVMLCTEHCLINCDECAGHVDRREPTF